MSYEDSAPSIAAQSALWALPLLDEDCDPSELGSITVETCQRLRTLALMALLGQGNDQQFLANLSRSVAGHEFPPDFGQELATKRGTLR